MSLRDWVVHRQEASKQNLHELCILLMLLYTDFVFVNFLRYRAQALINERDRYILGKRKVKTT
jgi:hypothetical protein